MNNKRNNNPDEIVPVDILDVLLDEDNNSPVYMYGANGETIPFDQIAVIPYGEDDIYAILKPLVKIPGIDEDDAIVFKVAIDENDESYLEIEEDEQIAEEIFDRYYELLLDSDEDDDELW